MRRIRNILLVASFVVLGVSWAAAARNDPRAQRNDPRAQWKNALLETSELLKRGSYKEALPILKKLAREMVERLGPGDAASQVFGIVITQRALAEAGLGHTEEAVWYWHVALGLYPTLANSDLSMFGGPGEFLKSIGPLRGVSTECTEDVTGEVQQPRVVQPPRVRSRVEPEFPRGALHFGIEGIFVAEVVITKDGTVTSPRVLQALPAPTLSYAALEALKRWKYEPATLDGNPAEVFLKVTVVYKLR